MRRALLLSGSLGAGHEVHARACATSLAGAGWATETLDAMRLLGRRGGSAGEAVFRGMLAMPGLYDAFHFAALRAGQPAGAAGRRRRPGGSWCRGCGTTSTRTRPTWPCRCSPPPRPR